MASDGKEEGEYEDREGRQIINNMTLKTKAVLSTV